MATTMLWGAECGDFGDVVTAGTVSIATSWTAGAWSAYSGRVNPATTGTGSIQVRPFGATGAVSTSLSIGTTVYHSVVVKIDTLPASGSEELIAFRTAANGNKAFLRINSDGTLAFYDATPTLVATGTFVWVAGESHLVECQIGPAGAGSALELKIDGAADITTTATLSGGNGAVYLGKLTNRNSQSVDYYFDDLTSSDSGYLGETRVTALLPDSAGNYQTWAPSTGTDHWAVVDERPPASADYLLSTGVIGNSETEGLQSTTTAGISGTVNGARSSGVFIRNAVNGAVRLRVRVGGSDDDTTSDVTTQVTAASISKFYGVNPTSGVAWTLSDLDGTETGAVERATTNKSRMTSTMLHVSWTPSGASTFTGTGALTAGAATLAGVATFAKPTYTGTGTLTVGVSTLAGVATFSKPIFAGIGILTTGHVVASASATFAKPTYTGSGSLTVGVASTSGVATFSTPVFTGTSALASGSSSLDASATFTPPTSTGVGDLSAVIGSLSAVATFTGGAETYTGVGSLNSGGASLDGLATFAPPVSTGVADLAGISVTLAASATFAVHTYTGVGSLTPSAATLQAAARYLVFGPIVTETWDVFPRTTPAAIWVNGAEAWQLGRIVAVKGPGETAWKSGRYFGAARLRRSFIMAENRKFSVDMGDDFSVLARVQIDRANAKSPVLQADLASVTREVYSVGTLASSTALTIADVIYDTLQTGTVWSRGDTGFNFKDQVSHTLLPAAGEYRLRYVFVLTGGTQFIEWWYVTIEDPRT